MYRVLIVDDERIIREGLAKHLPWKKHDMQVVGTAANADMALEILEKHQVDILITDIKMPIKSGFDLIRELTELGYMPQVILVSSYNEFAYAQQACVLDLVCDYVLKPVDVPTFENALTRAVQRLQRQEKEHAVLDTREYLSLLDLVDDIRFDLQKFAKELACPDKSIAPQTWRGVAETLIKSNCTPDTLVRFCSNLLLQIENLFQSRTFGACPYLKCMPEVHEKLAGIQNREALFLLMEQQIATICNYAHEDAAAGKSPLIISAISKVKKNYASVDLNLASLAAELNVTPNYLSIKFREEMAVPFTKYLTDWRLARAQELLADPKYRVSTVAAMVGFSDEKYFIRVFKSEIGKTPKKFQQTPSET